MSKMTVYIDESGTLPDPTDKVVIVAAIGTESVIKIDEIFKKVKKRGSLKKPGGEIKYYTAGDKTKFLFFEILEKEDIMICILIVDKMGRRITDTPDHYAALCLMLITDVLNFTPNIKELIFDRHFSRNVDEKIFNTIIKTLIGNNIHITHVDSKRDKRVNIADMVAGAALAKESGKDTRFYNLIVHKITSNKRVNWREVKKRLVATKKLA